MNDQTMMTIISGVFETLNHALVKLPEISGMFRRREVARLREQLEGQLAGLAYIAVLAEKHRNTLLYAESCAAGWALVDKSKEQLVALVLRSQTEGAARISKEAVAQQLHRALKQIQDAEAELEKMVEVRDAAEFIALHAFPTKKDEIQAMVTSVEDELRKLRLRIADMSDGIHHGKELRAVGLTARSVVVLYDAVKNPLVKLQAVLMASVRNEFSTLITRTARTTRTAA